MSIPTNSIGPTPPSGSSNPVPLKSWFIAIIDWIKALSPAGATVYDTGWISLTLTNGWVGSNPRVRRIGKTTYLGGKIWGGTLAVDAFVVPTGMTPSTRITTELRRAVGGVTVGKIDISTTGAAQVRESNSSTSSPGFPLGHISWLVD